jgi:hypothetical protein
MKIDSVREIKDILLTRPRSLGMAANPFTLEMSVGIAKAKGDKGYELAVRLHQKKHPLQQAFLEMLGKLSKNEMQVANVGEIKALNCPCLICEGSKPSDDTMWRQRRVRPLKIGTSFGHYAITCGTLGCFVQDQDGKVFALTNNHVAANQNDASEGDEILQPGTHDKGKRGEDKAGSLARFVELKDKGNLVDAAIVALEDGMEYDASTITGVGKTTGKWADVELGEEVFKFGRTTGTTRGLISAIEMDNIGIGYSRGPLYFDKQLEIDSDKDGEIVCRGGDSGSTWFNSKGDGVALLFAGSERGGRNGTGICIANPIDFVVNAFDGIKLCS